MAGEGASALLSLSWHAKLRIELDRVTKVASDAFLIAHDREKAWFLLMNRLGY